MGLNVIIWSGMLFWRRECAEREVWSDVVLIR